jgi:hypothetical protein
VFTLGFEQGASETQSGKLQDASQPDSSLSRSLSLSLSLTELADSVASLLKPLFSCNACCIRLPVRAMGDTVRTLKEITYLFLSDPFHLTHIVSNSILSGPNGG